MIKIEKSEIWGWKTAIRGIRINSCERSGSKYWIEDNDLKLMEKLVSADSDHSKFMRMIISTVDITAPIYWWKEFDIYKEGTVRYSCNTIHTMVKKEFTLDDFSHEHLDGCSVEGFVTIIDLLNKYRFDYIETQNKDAWWQIIQLLPSSYNQRATVQLNYAVLRNIYHTRKNHELGEWRDFCNWIESLPYSELITMESGN